MSVNFVEASDGCLNASIRNYWLENIAGWEGRQTDYGIWYLGFRGPLCIGVGFMEDVKNGDLVESIEL